VADFKRSHDLELLHAFYHTFVANQKGIMVTNISDNQSVCKYLHHSAKWFLITGMACHEVTLV